MVTSRTCQISFKMSQISVEVNKLDLRCQEDVLRFRKREHTLLCACILEGENILEMHYICGCSVCDAELGDSQLKDESKPVFYCLI